MKRGEFPRFPEAIVFKTKGVRITAVMKLIIAEVLERAEKFEGEPTCTPVFHFLHEGGAWMYYPCIGKSISHDPAALDQILLEMEELESVRHHRNFKPGEKISRPRKKKVKEESKGPFSKTGHDLSKIWSKLHFFFDEGPHPETGETVYLIDLDGEELRKVMDGYPFKNKTPVENARYLETEVINRLRDRFPRIYEMNRVLDNVIVEALKIMGKPEVQKYSGSDDFNLAMCFHARQHPSAISSACTQLRNLDYLIRTGKLQAFRKMKRMPDPEEASEDKLFMHFGTGRRAVNDAVPSDPELEYDESC